MFKHLLRLIISYLHDTSSFHSTVSREKKLNYPDVQLVTLVMPPAGPYSHAIAKPSDTFNDVASSYTTTTSFYRKQKRAPVFPRSRFRSFRHGRSLIDFWYDVLSMGVRFFYHFCEAFHPLVEFCMGLASTMIVSPWLLSVLIREGISGLTIPTLVNISRVPIVGSRFLGLVVSLHSPYSASISPRVDWYYLASNTDEEPYFCEVAASMSNVRSLYNAFHGYGEAGTYDLKLDKKYRPRFFHSHYRYIFGYMSPLCCILPSLCFLVYI